MGSIAKNNADAADAVDQQDTTVDLKGIKDVYVNSHRFEDAGNGMIRVIRGKQRNGRFVPESSHVMCVQTVIRDAEEALAFARRIIRGDGWAH